MTWAPAAEYKARIGGILYRNVAQPIVCNSKSLILLARNVETNDLVASFELVHQNGLHIASVIHNNVTLHAIKDYIVNQGLKRVAVIERETGRIWCDVRSASGKSEYELSISCLLFSKSGYPIILHPDRSRFGAADQKPASLINFDIAATPDSTATAIAVENGLAAMPDSTVTVMRVKNLPLLLIGMLLENCRTGVKITHRGEEDGSHGTADAADTRS